MFFQCVLLELLSKITNIIDSLLLIYYVSMIYMIYMYIKNIPYIIYKDIFSEDTWHVYLHLQVMSHLLCS